MEITKRHIWASRISFFIPGGCMAIWAAFVPFFKERLAIGEDLLGNLILLLGMGGLIAMPLVPKLVQMTNCRWIISLGNIGGLLTIVALLNVDTIYMAAICIFLIGLFMGMSDISANVQALMLERMTKKHLMSSLHGGWSLGSAIGALILIFLLQSLQITMNVTGYITVAILMALLIYAIPSFIGNVESEDHDKKRSSKGIISLHPWAILVGIITLVNFTLEGAIADWSALFLYTDKGFPITSATLGYLCFNITMTLARLLGDMIRNYCSANVIVTYGLLGSALAILGIVLGSGYAVLVCFIVLGFLSANIIPILFSSVGEQHEIDVHLALSTVTTLGYTGVLMGPAFIGHISHWFNLKVAFGGLGVALLIALFIYKRVNIVAKNMKKGSIK